MRVGAVLFVPSSKSHHFTADMTERPPIPPEPSAREQAVRWIVRLHSGAATSGDRRELDAWLASSLEHQREFDEAARMWTALDDAEPLLQSEIRKAEDLWADHDTSRWPTVRWSWRRWGQALRLGIALPLLLATGWWWTGLPKPILYETAKGEQRQEVLADGSTITLNTDTRLTVEFSRNERVVRVDRGEAWFTVSHEGRRPFTVQAANGAIRDIGTEFSVNTSSGGVRVLVWEGMVEVGVREVGVGVSTPQPTLLRAGEQLSYRADGLLSDIALFDRDREGSWKDGKLIFRSQPLKQVLTEIARYRTEDIRLLDQSLEAFPVSGVFIIQELDRAIETLEAALPIRARRVRDNVIILERTPALSAPRPLSRR